LNLRYDFGSEEWNATQNDKNVTAILDPTRANFMLGILEGLKVTRWLATDDTSANKALLDPTLTFKVFEKSTDDMGDFTGITSREIKLAPSTPGANPGFYYGRLGSARHPFLLDRDTYDKLAIDLFDK